MDRVETVVRQVHGESQLDCPAGEILKLAKFGGEIVSRRLGCGNIVIHKDIHHSCVLLLLS